MSDSRAQRKQRKLKHSKANKSNKHAKSSGTSGKKSSNNNQRHAPTPPRPRKPHKPHRRSKSGKTGSTSGKKSANNIFRKPDTSKPTHPPSPSDGRTEPIASMPTEAPAQEPCAADPVSRMFGQVSNSKLALTFAYEVESVEETTDTQLQDEILPAVEMNLLNNLLSRVFPNCATDSAASQRQLLIDTITPPAGLIIVGLSADPPDTPFEDIGCAETSDDRCDLIQGGMIMYMDTAQERRKLDTASDTLNLVRENMNSGELNDSHSSVQTVTFVDLANLFTPTQPPTGSSTTPEPVTPGPMPTTRPPTASPMAAPVTSPPTEAPALQRSDPILPTASPLFSATADVPSTHDGNDDGFELFPFMWIIIAMLIMMFLVLLVAFCAYIRKKQQRIKRVASGDETKVSSTDHHGSYTGSRSYTNQQYSDAPPKTVSEAVTDTDYLYGTEDDIYLTEPEDEEEEVSKTFGKEDVEDEEETIEELEVDEEDPNLHANPSQNAEDHIFSDEEPMGENEGRSSGWQSQYGEEESDFDGSRASEVVKSETPVHVEGVAGSVGVSAEDTLVMSQ